MNGRLRTLDRFACLVTALAYSAVSVASAPASAAGTSYTFTIYVEEANPTGHVFMGISDGKNSEKWGWYTGSKSLPGKTMGLIGCGGGELRSDTNTPYNVSKPYSITRHAYYVVKAHIVARRAAGEGGTASWSPFKHCGDFVLDVASAAGLKLSLPSSLAGYDRPGRFADYLRQHEGIEHCVETRTPAPMHSYQDEGSPNRHQFARWRAGSGAVALDQRRAILAATPLDQNCDKSTWNGSSSVGNWAGNWISGAYKFTISGGGSSFTVNYDWTDGSKTDKGSYNCRLTTPTHAECSWQSHWHDPDKEMANVGTAKLNLSGDSITGSAHEDSATPTWHLPQGLPTYDSAMKKGAEWPQNWTRKR